MPADLLPPLIPHLVPSVPRFPIWLAHPGGFPSLTLLTQMLEHMIPKLWITL